MSNDLIINTDNLYEYMKSVEKYEENIYACSSKVPTIGVGFALLIEGESGWQMRKNLFSRDKSGVFKSAGVSLPNKKEIKNIVDVLEKVRKKLNNDKTDAAEDLIDNNSKTLNKLSINNKQSKKLFKDVQKEYEEILFNRLKKKAGVSKKKAKEIIKSLSEDEQIALFSSVYTASTAIGPGLSEALKEYVKDDIAEKDKAYNKAKAWFEIRNNTHESGWEFLNDKVDEKGDSADGLANRRYKDSLKFGLYGLSQGDNISMTQKQKDGVRDFLYSEEGRDSKSVLKTIKTYEKSFSPQNEDLGDKKHDKITEILKYLNKNPVKQIKKQAENNDRKIDNLSEEFLKKYDKKHGIVLNKQKPIYYSVEKIMKNKDILIFYLMNRLVIKMEKGEKNAKSSSGHNDLSIKIKKFKNRCKKTLEKVIKLKGGYKRKGYKKDNKEDIKDSDLKNKLVDAFRPQTITGPKTKKSYAFFKSFQTREDKQKKKKQAKSKSDEESKKSKSAKSSNKSGKSRHTSKNQESDKVKNKNEGWVIAPQGPGENQKYMDRKDYYDS